MMTLSRLMLVGPMPLSRDDALCAILTSLQRRNLASRMTNCCQGEHFYMNQGDSSYLAHWYLQLQMSSPEVSTDTLQFKTERCSAT
jgi:hypothetical protein